MSEVFFMGKDCPDKVCDILKKLALEDFSEKEVLVKLHMGERGNQLFLREILGSRSNSRKKSDWEVGHTKSLMSEYRRQIKTGNHELVLRNDQTAVVLWTGSPSSASLAFNSWPSI